MFPHAAIKMRLSCIICVNFYQELPALTVCQTRMYKDIHVLIFTFSNLNLKCSCELAKMITKKGEGSESLNPSKHSVWNMPAGRGVSWMLNQIWSFHYSIRLNILVTKLSLFSIQNNSWISFHLMRRKAGYAVWVFCWGTGKGYIFSHYTIKLYPMITAHIPHASWNIGKIVLLTIQSTSILKTCLYSSVDQKQSKEKKG